MPRLSERPEPSLATPLVISLAGRIRDEIVSNSIPVGTKLATQGLADRYGVSRSPIREALSLLSEQQIIEQVPNRGFFTKDLPKETLSAADPLPREANRAYYALADDWIADRIDSDITEQMLRDRYDLTRTQVSDILMRASREGWAERKEGYGWRLLPVAKTPEAFEQIYRFRMVVEPAGFLEPSFRLDRGILAEQRRIQSRMLDIDIASLPAERLLENGSLFHEELLRMSGNPFLHMSLVRINRMRRLLEYRASVDRERLRIQCSDHLRILDALDRNEVLEASYLMRTHLGGALERKSPLRWTPTGGREVVIAETTVK